MGFIKQWRRQGKQLQRRGRADPAIRDSWISLYHSVLTEVRPRSHDFRPGVGLLAIVGLQRELQEMLGAEVDVVPESCLKDSHRGMLEDAIVL